MVRNRAFSSRRLTLACAAALLLASAGARAQMTAGGVSGMQAVQAAQNPGTVMTTQPSSAYSNPYSNNGVASNTARPTINGQGDPYAPSTTQGAATGQYATPMGSSSIMPTNLQTMPNSGQAYGGAPGYYGGAGEPTAAPSYSVQAQPAGGPYAPVQQAYPRPSRNMRRSLMRRSPSHMRCPIRRPSSNMASRNTRRRRNMASRNMHRRPNTPSRNMPSPRRALRWRWRRATI